ncbi:hypothetical protein [Chitinophaga sancti]|uniref:hypothetical protein n=1 Tax=Chitinophaga sancti TaxID=1004 RepID=UPI003F78E83A
MELDHYIQSGIIESYVLGLATNVEVEELQYMRRLYPELNSEIAAVEKRMEITAFAEAVPPPAQLKDRIFQRINWKEEESHEATDYRRTSGQHQQANYNTTYINIQPKDNQYITVHKWWKLFFIAVFIISKICLASAIYFFVKSQMQEKKLEQLTPRTEVHTNSR